MNGRPRGRALRIFGIPLLLAAVTLFGLIAALMADGAWDAVSALALAIPVAIVCWKSVTAWRASAARRNVSARQSR